MKQCHQNEDSYECFLKILRKSLQSKETGDVLQLVNDINSEFEQEVPTNLVDKIVDFYKRKNSKQKERFKKLGENISFFFALNNYADILF